MQIIQTCALRLLVIKPIQFMYGLGLCLLVASSLPVAKSHAATVELTEASVADLNAAFDKGTLTSESLVKMYLARIQAYDQKGPKINAVLAVNAKAIETAQALDKERKQKGATFTAARNTLCG